MQELEMKHERLLADERNGSIPVDNNRAENAIRPFVVGRKTGFSPRRPREQKPVRSSILSPPRRWRMD